MREIANANELKYLDEFLLNKVRGGRELSTHQAHPSPLGEDPLGHVRNGSWRDLHFTLKQLSALSKAAQTGMQGSHELGSFLLSVVLSSRGPWCQRRVALSWKKEPAGSSPSFLLCYSEVSRQKSIPTGGGKLSALPVNQYVFIYPLTG